MNHRFLTLPRSGLRIACSDEGSGPVIVFVHGVAESMLVWKFATEILQKKFRCICIDLPGHGHSWEQRGSFTMSFYAGILLECLDVLRLDEIILCGHSMGGQISIIAALQHPARISKLILAAPAGIETFTADEKKILIDWSEKAYAQPAPVTQLQFLFRQQLRHRLEHADWLTQMQADQNSPERFGKWRETIMRSIEGMLQEPVSSFLPSLQQKTLLLFGENDALIPNRYLHAQLSTAQVARQGEAMIPAAQLKLISDSGHYFPFEKPEEFAEAVNEFLL